MDFSGLFNSLMTAVINFTNNVIAGITHLLPTSPFDAYIAGARSVPILKMLNYFLPIGAWVEITLAWAQALLFFYGEAIVVRWVKIVKG